jgi:ABC-type transport system involved in multi-copper enzyme maturation permease subunit
MTVTFFSSAWRVYMLIYKAWLETRWQFILGMIVLCGMSAGLVLIHPWTVKYLSSLQSSEVTFGGKFNEIVEVMKDFNHYAWSQWFPKNLLQIWVLMAVLIGVGGIVTESSRGNAIYMLSLPVTRRRLHLTRVLAGLSEVFLLALVPSLLIPALAPLISESFSVRDTIVYTIIFLSGGMVFFFYSVLLSSLFTGILKPILSGIATPFLLGFISMIPGPLNKWSVFRLMAGEEYHATGRIPWIGTLICMVISLAFFFLSLRNVERRDF